MKKEYMITCQTFENELIDGSDFDSPLYGKDYYMEYKPSIKEIKSAYGKGWEYIKYIVITEIPENAKTSDDYTEEIIKNEDY